MKDKHIPHWDLSNVYPSLESEAFTQDVERLRALLDELDDYLAERLPGAGEDPAALAEITSGYLERKNAFQRLHLTLNSYVYSFVATDSYNTVAKRAQSEVDILSVRGHQQTVQFQNWIGRVASLLPQILEHGGTAGAHAFYLGELAQQSQYLMSEAEESLASELALSGAMAWQKLQGTLCSQLAVKFGQEKLPITTLQNIRSYDPDGQVRQRAYEAEIAAWESVREPLAACLNGVKGAVGVVDRRRGREDALHAALDKSRIDRATLEALLDAIQGAFPVFRQYLHAKAARFGKQALPWWDVFAPVGQAERRFTFPQARDFILQQFGGFSERLANFAQRAFDHNWVDAEPRDGKRGGAFCMSLPAVDESRLLCNFDGSLGHVLTLAHELGHAYHNECKIGATMLNKTTPMTLAETASIFCETIVTDAMLAQAANADEELAILEAFLVKSTQVIVDISSRYLFEKEVFERRAQAELSADDFCDIMLRAQQDTFGDGLDERHRHPYMWAWKPHYYRPTLSFYNYPYAFGLLFGLGLYAVYQERGAAFLPDYDALLADTGQGTAADLAARFGLHIRQPAFWQNSLQIIAARVQRYLEL